MAIEFLRTSRTIIDMGANPFGALSSGATFACWVNFVVLPDLNYGPGFILAGGGNTPFVTYMLSLVNDAGTYKWRWRRTRHGIADSFVVDFTETPTTGVWFHVCGTYDGSTNSAIYTNGVIRTTGGGDNLNGNSSANTHASLLLGREYYTGDDNTTRYLDARLEDVRVFSSAITAAQIAVLAGGFRGPLGSESMWIRGDNPNGNLTTGTANVFDMSGNGYHGTPQGGSSYVASFAPRLGTFKIG
jgi:hypothetical protein